MNEEKTSPQITPEEIAKQGEEIYEKEFRKKLEPKESGKYVAIEVESKKYFIGGTKEEALDEAQKVFPNKIFFVRRIGELEKVASKYSFDFTSSSAYDRLF
ncbi:MAG: hypothetical protein COX89_01195 [Candidatus Nealsonbacteria bacterium CG_4_10_14_0_2_um_filter_37_10]|uniref:DUF5678 domain-containing protein n=3 Tax=Candidatus Nealsoniibacteriota TaxID=1817911 RepID=A0A2M7UZZ7_9BACT|nr:MAG: hypothetical protein COU43_00850 [Candidatus Nealsonbacteria bacterium CG10_big_fil_rev_8_21_14_0_10_37_25]PIZ89508.1 MAG: hypothetical protein COX89_01195 [Candidatus Nealsonbacteria bacterium CG_4_10_14_0_2_um_filter_37_10]PJA84308.1 MAG: hypothetical protein CO145_01455 [Candidatus Nealsonbacteria bacterium CG_4_9_14_3_um_filter_37_13]